MLRYKRIVFLLLLLLLSLTALTHAAPAAVVQTSTLSGRVSGYNLINAGAAVKEGQVLLYIDSVAGPAPAARATVNGVVAEVLVKPGEQMKSGQAVARIMTDK